MNVGTIRVRSAPRLPARETGMDRRDACRRRGWGGAAVVLRARESRCTWEGRQRVSLRREGNVRRCAGEYRRRGAKPDICPRAAQALRCGIDVMTSKLPSIAGLDLGCSRAAIAHPAQSIEDEQGSCRWPDGCRRPEHLLRPLQAEQRPASLRVLRSEAAPGGSHLVAHSLSHTASGGGVSERVTTLLS